MSSNKRSLEECCDVEIRPLKMSPQKRLRLADGYNEITQRMEHVIRREFSTEIQRKEEEIELINSRLYQARRLLDQLRACIVASYYGRVMSSNQQQPSRSVDPTPIHPAVKKLIGKTVRHHGGSSQTPLARYHDMSSSSSLSDTSSSVKSCSSGYASTEVTSRASLISTCHSLTESAATTSKASVQVPHTDLPYRVTKRIVVGNVSKYLAAGKKDASRDRMQYKWMVYVQGASKEERDISHFVDKVVFMLDESYRPNDIITVAHPPFQLKRHGWGEFPVRVQLHFKGFATKSVNIIHELKLDKTHTGWTTLGAETTYDISVDGSLFGQSHTSVTKSPTSRGRRGRCPTSQHQQVLSAVPVDVQLEAVIKAEPSLEFSDNGGCWKVPSSGSVADQRCGVDITGIKQEISTPEDAVAPVSVWGSSRNAAFSSVDGLHVEDQQGLVQVKVEPTSPQPEISNESIDNVGMDSSCGIFSMSYNDSSSSVFCDSSIDVCAEESVEADNTFNEVSSSSLHAAISPVYSTSSPLHTVKTSASVVVSSISQMQEIATCRDSTVKFSVISSTLPPSQPVKATTTTAVCNGVLSLSSNQSSASVVTANMSSSAIVTLSSVGRSEVTRVAMSNQTAGLSVFNVQRAVPQPIRLTAIRNPTHGCESTVATLKSGQLARAQLARGQYFTTVRGQRIFIPTGARPIVETNSTPQSSVVPASNAPTPVVVLPSTSNVSFSSQGLSSSTSVISVRRPVLTKVAFPSPTLTSPSMPQTRLAVPKLPTSNSPVYLLLGGAGSGSGSGGVNSKTSKGQPAPVQFLLMSNSNIRNRAISPTQSTPASDAQTVARMSQPAAAVAPSIRPGNCVIAMSLSKPSPCQTVSSSSPLIMRAKPSGPVSLLRLSTPVQSSTATTTVSSNATVLSGGKVFATRIGGQTVLVDMTGSTGTAGPRNMPNIPAAMSKMSALASNGLASTVSSSAALQSVFATLRSDKQPIFRAVDVGERKPNLEVSSVGRCKSMEEVVRLAVRQYPVVGLDIDRSLHPYCASTWESFLNWNIGKRRAAELCRAKAVQDCVLRALNGARCFRGEEIWSRRRIISWCRRHMYTPIDQEIRQHLKKSAPSSSSEGGGTGPTTVGPSVTPLSILLDTLNVASNNCNGGGGRESHVVDSDQQIDIIEIDDDEPNLIKNKHLTPTKIYGLKEYLPMSTEAQFVHNVMDKFGIRPSPTQVEGFPTIFSSSVEELIARTMKLLVEDLLRTTSSVMCDSGRPPVEITALDLHRTLVLSDKFDFLTNQHMGVVTNKLADAAGTSF